MFISDMTNPAAVHETLCQMAKERAGADYGLGRWLLAADRIGVHRILGYACFGEYAQRLFGFTRRQASERLRVARALESMPALAGALRNGDKPWSVVRELTRVATEDTEREWNEAASGRTARQVERMVAQHDPGDLPTDPPRAEPPRRIALEVSAPTWALFVEEAREAVTAELGEHVTDDQLVATLARAVLAGTTGAGVAKAAPATPSR